MFSFIGMRRIIVAVAALAVTLACGGVSATQAPPAFDPTKAALEIQGTAMALQLTQSAINNAQPQAPALPEPFPPLSTP